MKATDIIEKKRDGGELTQAEIGFFITGLTRGDIPDYQVAAWAMAVYFRGMTAREMTALTLAMAHSGETIDLSDTVPFAVDKHSTGGVGDKVTLVVEPLVAACGVPVGKMSGRGLGFSGGTIDKLESIPGINLALDMQQFKRQLKDIGLVLTGQSGQLAPADGKLYALRDVTGTVQSIPLIASSVMSKKIAGGAQAIVLDVKVGSGAFMTTLKEATALAQAMVSIGKHAGRRVVAVLSDMNQPLGHAVGNALELREALEALRDAGPRDLREHCLLIGSQLLVLARKAKTPKAARALLEAALADGRALAKFREMVQAQGGDVRVVDEPDRLVKAALIETVIAPRTGYIAEVNAREVGLAAVDLGAGRARKGDALDYAVGFVIHRKVSERIKKGEPLFTVHASNAEKLAVAKARVLAAHKISAKRVKALPLYYEILKSR